MSDEKARFEIRFFAVGAFKNRQLHFAVRDAAENMNIVGEVRWHLGCLHEVVVEGEEDTLTAYAVWVNDKLLEQVDELDDYRYENVEPSGEYNKFTSLFVTSNEEKIAVPKYANELNRIEEEDHVNQ